MGDVIPIKSKEAISLSKQDETKLRAAIIRKLIADRLRKLDELPTTSTSSQKTILDYAESTPEPAA